MTICTRVCLQPPIMVFVTLKQGLGSMFLQFIPVTHQLPAHILGNICINALKIQLFVHIDVMLMICGWHRLLKVFFTLIWQHTDFQGLIQRLYSKSQFQIIKYKIRGGEKKNLVGRCTTAQTSISHSGHILTCNCRFQLRCNKLKADHLFIFLIILEKLNK